MYIFISYATPDVEIAKQCLQALEKENMECFFAPRDIQMGHIYANDILDAINRSDVFLLLLSKAAEFTACASRGGARSQQEASVDRL